MQVKVTWPGNEAGEQIPLLAVKPVLLRVSLVDVVTGQAIAEPHRLVATFGTLALPVARREGNSVEYCVPAALGLRPFFPNVVITATPTAGGAPRQVRLKVIGRALDGAARAAVFFLALAVLYTFILVPNLEGALKFLSDKPTLPLLGAGTLIVGFWRDWWIRQLRHPFRPIAMALLAMALLYTLYLKRSLVLNRSLETIDLKSGARIAPGAFMIIDELDLPENPALCSQGTEDRVLIDDRRDCVRFGDQPDVGLVLNTLLLLRKTSIGCVDSHLRPTPLEAWRKAGGCPPKSGIHLERVTPENALIGYDRQQGRADRVTVQMNWQPPSPKADNGTLDWTNAAQLQVLTLTPSTVSAGTMDIAFRRTSPELRIETALDFGVDLQRSAPIRLLSPLRRESGGLLESDVVVGQAVAGKLTSKLAPWACPDPRAEHCATSPDAVSCWLADSGERLSQFLIRDTLGRNSSLFTTQTPELVSQIPICWSWSDHSKRPDYAELHLDASWAPSDTWSLDLPARIAPLRISIFDQKGEYWGRADCPDAVDQSPFHIGPIGIDKPRLELATLGSGKPERWSADATHVHEHWAWLCWTGEPPRSLSGRGLWSLHTPSPGRKYQASPTLRHCQMNVAGNEVPTCKTKVSSEQAKAWFKAHGPADCHPDSTLCQ